MQFFYVYLLQSKSSSDHYYVGFTEGLAQRLKEHNDGKLPDTAWFCPWHIKSSRAQLSKTAWGDSLTLKTAARCSSGR
jgi:hypothetical protein